MEAVGRIRTVARSDRKFSLTFTECFEDRDSSSFKKVTDSMPYGSHKDIIIIIRKLISELVN